MRARILRARTKSSFGRSPGLALVLSEPYFLLKHYDTRGDKNIVDKILGGRLCAPLWIRNCDTRKGSLLQAEIVLCRGHTFA